MAGQKCNKILSELGRVIDYQSPVSKLSMGLFLDDVELAKQNESRNQEDLEVETTFR